MNTIWRWIKVAVVVMTPLAILFGVWFGVFWAIGKLMERSMP